MFHINHHKNPMLIIKIDWNKQFFNEGVPTMCPKILFRFISNHSKASYSSSFSFEKKKVFKHIVVFESVTAKWLGRIILLLSIIKWRSPRCSSVSQLSLGQMMLGWRYFVVGWWWKWIADRRMCHIFHVTCILDVCWSPMEK